MPKKQKKGKQAMGQKAEMSEMKQHPPRHAQPMGKKMGGRPKMQAEARKPQGMSPRMMPGGVMPMRMQPDQHRMM